MYNNIDEIFCTGGNHLNLRSLPQGTTKEQAKALGWKFYSMAGGWEHIIGLPVMLCPECAIEHKDNPKWIEERNNEQTLHN